MLTEVNHTSLWNVRKRWATPKLGTLCGLFCPLRTQALSTYNDANKGKWADCAIDHLKSDRVTFHRSDGKDVMLIKICWLTDGWIYQLFLFNGLHAQLTISALYLVIFYWKHNIYVVWYEMLCSGCSILFILVLGHHVLFCTVWQIVSNTGSCCSAGPQLAQWSHMEMRHPCLMLANEESWRVKRLFGHIVCSSLS